MRSLRLAQPAVVAFLAGAFALSAVPASAAVIPISAAAFGPGSTLTTFDGEAAGAEVNGLTVDGILFGYSLGNGDLDLGGGPGVTANISPLNIVSTGDSTGELSMSLPSLARRIGYGFAVLSTVAVPGATTISLFDGAVFVGSLSFDGSPDPTFAGGFAGIESTLPFNRVVVTFATGPSIPAFALDNIRTEAVPEPASILLLGAGLVAAARRIRLRAR
jgi:hypothetical protein